MRHAVSGLIALWLTFWPCDPAAAQMVREHDAVATRGFHGVAGRIRRSFQSDAQANAVLKQVLVAAGLAGMDDRIKIRASAQTANAEAAIDKNERLIFYNAEFMQEITQQTRNYWSMIAILAHEVGHHVRFHTILPGREHEFELEADYQAGFILARMGARLDEAQAAFRTFQVEATKTHPGRAERVQAVTIGWTDGASGAAPPPMSGPAAPHVIARTPPTAQQSAATTQQFAINQTCSNMSSMTVTSLRYEPTRTVLTVRLPGWTPMMIDGPGSDIAIVLEAEDMSERLALVDVSGPFTPNETFVRTESFDATFVFGPSRTRPTRFALKMEGGTTLRTRLNCRNLVVRG